MSILQKLKYCYLSLNTRTLRWLNLSSHAQDSASARNRNYVTFFIEKVSLFNRQKYKKAKDTQKFSFAICQKFISSFIGAFFSVSFVDIWRYYWSHKNLSSDMKKSDKSYLKYNYGIKTKRGWKKQKKA